MTGFGQPRVGVGVVVRHGNRVLLGVRRGSHGAGEWALPGGRIDPGETPDVTAARELTEETGLVAQDLRPVGFWSTDLFEADGQHWVTLYYLCDWDGTEPVVVEPHKCDGWAWHEWDQLPRPIFNGVIELTAAYPSPDVL
jgi:8-oxo-dGTP diphosphatase